MKFEFDGFSVFAATGGVTHEPRQPLIVFMHGAGMDHSVWALQSRWFAHNGARVLAVDFPGHGQSAGPPLADIGALSDWTARLIEAAGAERGALVGHSMGALVALETAARHPGRVGGLVLIGAAAKMPVHPDLLAAAKANSQDAIDMVALWGLGASAALGGNPSPGLWMLGGAERLLERAGPGVLHADLHACNAYEAGAESAAKVACPATFVLGERDQMTPLKAGRALAGQIAGARTIVLAGAGHMLMVQRPDEVRAAIGAALSQA
jgi:pimeloyl-ACP methyl ester carboxylesterase